MMTVLGYWTQFVLLNMELYICCSILWFKIGNVCAYSCSTDVVYMCRRYELCFSFVGFYNLKKFVFVVPVGTDCFQLFLRDLLLIWDLY